MTPHDPIGVALGSIGAGASAGASVITAGLIVYRALQGEFAGALSQDQQFLIITAGLGAGLATAITMSLILSRTIRDLWRRGVIAASTVFAATILAAVAAPADILGGGVGLIVYAALLVAAASYSRNKARAAAGE